MYVSIPLCRLTFSIAILIINHFVCPLHVSIAMLKGMDLFQEKMNSGEFCVKEVVRVKNGVY